MMTTGDIPVEFSFKVPKYCFLPEKCKFFQQIEILSLALTILTQVQIVNA
jgi:hypothetical protein